MCVRASCVGLVHSELQFRQQSGKSGRVVLVVMDAVQSWFTGSRLARSFAIRLSRAACLSNTHSSVTVVVTVISSTDVVVPFK